MAKERMTLHFYDNAAIALDLVDENGIVITKNINYDILSKCIFDSAEEKGSMKSGLFPPGILCYEMYYHGNNKEVVCTFVHDRPHEDVTYHETRYADFPLPRLLFSFRFNQNNKLVNRVKVGIIPLTKTISLKTPMFYYPFSNIIDNSQFRMCMGTNRLYLRKPIDLPRLAQFILRCPNNDDYYDSSRNKPNLEQRDLMELLKDKDQQYYYDNILIPIPNTTVDDFLKE